MGKKEISKCCLSEVHYVPRYYTINLQNVEKIAICDKCGLETGTIILKKCKIK